MTHSPRLDTARGYVAMRFDETLLLVDALAVRDIRTEADGAGRFGSEPDVVAPAGSLQALAEGRRTQIVVLDDGQGEVSLACDEVAVLTAGSITLAPLRNCMKGPQSLCVAVCRTGGGMALFCSALRLAAAMRKLAERTHG